MDNAKLFEACHIVVHMVSSLCCRCRRWMVNGERRRGLWWDWIGDEQNTYGLVGEEADGRASALCLVLNFIEPTDARVGDDVEIANDFTERDEM